jgi:hypothetical protein
MIKGRLLVTEQWFLHNKKQSNAHKMRPPRIEVALDCLFFYFDKAVKIVCRDVEETLSSIVHEINRMRKDFPRDD